MTDPQALRDQRAARWGQSPATSTPDPDSAARLIERLGLVTLFPVSPELPDLFHAYTGDPNAQTTSGWDTPSGHVYTWRWELGRREAGFYTAIVRGRPTFVAWPLLPAILRLRGDLRDPEELYDLGQLSNAAYRVARALAEAGGVLDTGTLRRAAGFPTGKDQRAAYLKAVAELDAKLLLAKVFSPGDEEMRHALVQLRYPDHVAAAEALTREAALDLFLATYLPHAAYAVPTPLARHLGLPLPELRAALDRLVAQGQARSAAVPGEKEAWIVWTAGL
jgi:hypothetical protein